MQNASLVKISFSVYFTYSYNTITQNHSRVLMILSVTIVDLPGNSDVDMAVIAQTSKLIGNSAYAIHLIDEAKFDTTFYLNKAATSLNS